MRRRPRPFYRADRRLWYVQLRGKQINLGPDKRRAFARYEALVDQPLTEPMVVGPDSVVALIDLYLDWCSKNRAPDTYRWYKDNLQRFARRYPDLLVSELRVFHVQQWVDSYSHLSSGGKRNYCRAIQRAMRWSEEQGLIDRSPIAHLKKPRAGRRKTVITPEQYEEILSLIPSDDFRDLVSFAWHTGARAQECVRLERRHLELDYSRIVFPVDEEKMERAPRVIYLGDEAQAIIRGRRLSVSQRLFTNSGGVPWTTDAVNCQFEQLRIRMGMRRLRSLNWKPSEKEIAECIAQLRTTRRSGKLDVTKTPGQMREEARRKLAAKEAKKHAPRYCLTAFRHSWCHHALRRGLDALTVSVLMGHSDPSMVAKVYSHLSHAPEYLLAQARRVAATPG